MTPIVADIRKRAIEAGRDPASLVILTMMTVITAPTEAEAQDKYAEYQNYVNTEGALGHCHGKRVWQRDRKRTTVRA